MVAAESLTVTEDGMNALLELSNGDMRRALNILQSTSMAHAEVSENNIYTCTGQPKRSDIEDMLEWMLNKEFSVAYRNVQVLKKEKGIALQDILTEVHKYVHKIDFPTNTKIMILDKMADIEYRLAAGASEKIQTTALLSIFQRAKNTVAAEA